MRVKAILAFGIILCLSVLAQAQLDFRFTSGISYTPNPAKVSDAVTFTVRFIADGAAADNFKVVGGVDDTRILDRTFAHLNIGASRAQSMSWTATAGHHTVWFEIDPDHVSGDTNFTNNRVEITLTVDPTMSSPARSSDELGDMTPNNDLSGSNFGKLVDTSKKMMVSDNCALYVDEVPDVEMEYIRFERLSSRVDDPIQWKYEFKINNLSNKCVTKLKFRLVDKTGGTIKEDWLESRVSKFVLKSMKSVTHSGILGMEDISNFQRCPFHGQQFWCSTITAIADSDDALNESDENNNSKTIEGLLWNDVED